MRYFIKRDDLLHPVIEGNKYRKLKYNYKQFIIGNYQGILTYGGAFSNHLVAVSQLGAICNFPTIGRLNNNYANKQNPTLSICTANGMTILHKDEPLSSKFETMQLFEIPLGGSNVYGIKGCEQITAEIRVQIPQVTHLITPSGTGSTILGMAAENPDLNFITINALKMNWNAHIRAYYNITIPENITAWDDYHAGKFGSVNPALVDFIQRYFEQNGIMIDPLYNAKALYALEKKLDSGYFPNQSKIVYVHTGGSQGILGINERYGYQFPAHPISHYIVRKD